AAEGAWRVLGNLPYNVASRIIWDMAPRMAGLSCAVFMVQLEVAERLRAEPGGKVYGALGAWVQAFCRVRLLFKVGPHLFRPRPKVESAVVRLEARAPRAHAAPPERLAGIIRQAFQNRRKQLPGALGPLWTPAMAGLLEQLGIPSTIRPERLSSDLFWALAEAKTPES
ncbi:MAG: rRNA adenine dimethyltransferase family protein, partial [Desulfovibrionaceae bacterium]